MDADRLVEVVLEHCVDEPIVPSATIRWILGSELGERRDNPAVSWNGAEFQRADREARKSGDLQKWRRKVGKNVGWSPSRSKDRIAFGKATEWADRKGWERIG